MHRDPPSQKPNKCDRSLCEQSKVIVVQGRDDTEKLKEIREEWEKDNRQRIRQHNRNRRFW
jgi:5S rRNA maturation endonuclease (ribonuclease M5)